MSTKDWIEKDYYKVLGVDKKASAEEIKKAFRKTSKIGRASCRERV